MSHSMKGKVRTEFVSSLRSGSVARTVRSMAALGMVFAFCCGMSAVEHPGALGKDADCRTCHAAKVSGKSVHSVMEASCTVCHVAMTKGDMTMMSLSMPREKICSACHEETAALRQHVPAVKGACVECHDAHSSERRMLLLSTLKQR
ncbi:MAG TPA: cytochrome c3 family protein [Candidatus Sulfotelmatobacter sp.]|nr:cytochrome c3 family protein [Candidatus Sulfotelmatobacter sp.]